MMTLRIDLQNWQRKYQELLINISLLISSIFSTNKVSHLEALKIYRKCYIMPARKEVGKFKSDRVLNLTATYVQQ